MDDYTRVHKYICLSVKDIYIYIFYLRLRDRKVGAKVRSSCGIEGGRVSMARKSEALLEEESIIRNRFLTQTTVATSTGGGPPFRRLANR